MESIYNQTAAIENRITFEHIIIDGLSTDRTEQIIRQHCKKNTAYIREKDGGMYDALAKGFKMCRGEIVCYLNAGDYFLPSAFDTIHSVANDVGGSWFTAIQVHFGPQQMITMADPPFRFRSDLIRKGVYGTHLPFIQQESTFWRRELLEDVDLERLSRFRLAGDYYLWWCFAQRHQLNVVHSILGGFSIHPGQLSQDKIRYLMELSSFTQPRNWKDRLVIFGEKILWATSPFYRRKLNGDSIQFDYSSNKWSKSPRRIW